MLNEHHHRTWRMKLALSKLSEHDCIILDTCSVLSIYATGQMQQILSAMSISTAIAEYVLNEEVKWIYSDDGLGKVNVDLNPLISSGTLSVIELTPDEEETSVNYMVSNEDGEAITGAVAFHRNWAVATDEKKTIAFLKSLVPHIEVFTTPEILKHWVDTTSASFEDVCIAIRNIEKRRGYKIAKNHPLKAWWLRHTEDNQ